MTPDVLGILGRVQQELGELIDVLDRDGPVYARAYLEHLVERGGNGAGPRPPVGLSPAARVLVRDLVLDEALAARCNRSGS